jgi:RNA polymerase sigma-70 factor (ECF subfamily)
MNWQDLAGRYGDLVRRAVRPLLRDEAQALDVAQEALLKIGRTLQDPAETVGDPEAWVIAVARNAARDALRRKTRRREVAIEKDIVDERRPEGARLREESLERVAEALETLPSGSRQVLLLKFRDGRSGPEIAAELGVSLEAAWQKVSRAMKLLKTHLAENP